TEYRVEDLPDDLAAHIKVNPVTGCWEWQLRLSPQGYGIIYRDGQNRRVHCLVYSMLAEPIPSGLDLDHVWDRGCRSKACCWPTHLEPVERAENSRRNVRVLTELRRLERSKVAGTVVLVDDVRRRWSDLLDSVEHHDAHVTVMRYRKPAAVIVPIAWYEKAQRTIQNGEQS
ncbi:MAG TPA: type II toxin-antitoxin system prevent-host-death family antitoxin, partial [Streptosporangiaceae bacterium]|nr:type II toxin-antitoxin system prevent-host-death family antitoxin [Streptosporangiaceae bacterium]